MTDLSVPPLHALIPNHATLIQDDAHAIDVARQLAAQFAQGAVQRDQERLLPWAELDAFSASGLWGITVPRTFGGAGVSNGTLAEVIATISAADGSLGQIPQNHFYALEVLRVGGSPSQQRHFFARALAGERFGNALAEIGNKDFKRRVRLTADGDGWRIQGRKFYCTGALYAHWIPTLVVRDDTGRDVTYLTFVPRHTDGVNITDDWDGFGQRVTASGTVDFDNVRVEDAWVVPFLTSFENPTTIGPVAQIMHAAIDLDQDVSRRWIRESKQTVAPIDAAAQTQFQATADFLLKEGVLTTPFNVHAVADNSFSTALQTR